MLSDSSSSWQLLPVRSQILHTETTNARLLLLIGADTDLKLAAQWATLCKVLLYIVLTSSRLEKVRTTPQKIEYGHGLGDGGGSGSGSSSSSSSSSSSCCCCCCCCCCLLLFIKSLVLATIIIYICRQIIL